MAAEVSSSSRLAVAIVAPSLSILGGQGVQARRLLDAWDSDPDISAFLVPLIPKAPRWLRPPARVRYVRTVFTQLIYLPRLARALLRADVVHIFSASSVWFLLAPVPAVILARLLGRPMLMNL